MGISFQPLLFSGFVNTGAGGAVGDAHWQGPVANAAALPPSGNNPGDVRVTLDTSFIWVWTGSAWQKDGQIPGGSQYDIQFNDGSGGFSGDDNLIWNGAGLTANGYLKTTQYVSTPIVTTDSGDLTLESDSNNVNINAISTVTNGGTSIAYGTTNAFINSGTSETGLTLNNNGTGGNSWSVVATNNSSGLGGGQFAILDVTGAADRFVIHNTGDIVLKPQSGNVEVTGDITATTFIGSLTGAASLNVLTSAVGANNGVASLDSAGHVPLSQLPSTLVEYKGTWAASTNTPTLANGTGTAGWFYIASDGGTVNFGAGNITFNAGDWVLYNGSIWQRAVQSNIVQSVNGQTGVVTINAINQLTGDVTAGPASGSASAASTVAKIQGTTVSGTTGTSNVVFSAAPTISGTATFTGSVSSPTIFYPSGPAISIQSGYATDSSGVHKFDWVNGFLADSSGISQLTWSTSGLNVPQIAISRALTTDSSHNIVGTQYTASNTASTLILRDISGNFSAGTITASLTGHASLDLAIANNLSDLNNAATARTNLGVTAASAGDISETSFSAANNQSAAANVTGFTFANATVRAFDALVSVYLDATSSLYATYKITGIQRGSDWQISQSYAGDNVGITFSITTAGQVQYQSTNASGFVSNTIKFRAITTTV